MKLLKLLTYLFIFTLMPLIFTGCSTDPSSRTKQVIPDDFNFSLTYGTYGKQKIDTFNDVVVKDLVQDGVIEAEIALTESEMNQIYNEMISINVMGDLDLEDSKECLTEPPSYTAWNIQMNGQTQSINYSSFCEYPDDILELLQLKELIHNIILDKNEYKELPEANGSYE